MGFLDLPNEPHHLDNIQRALKARNLRMDPSDDWEIHGPHSADFNFQVYTGFAYDGEEEDSGMWVVIYPRAVYEIDDAEDWYKRDPERRISIAPRVKKR